MEEDNKNREEVREEVREEENKPLSREEILEISRKENKNGDERDNRIFLRGMHLAYSIGVVLIAIIIIVYSIMDGELPRELIMVYMGMSAAWSIYYSVKTDKRRPLFISCGVLCSVAFAFFAVYWILGLCGVV